jgi:peptidoglycan lytic transglycosylase
MLRSLALAGLLTLALTITSAGSAHSRSAALYWSEASWYGPGLWGNRLGCGGTFTRSTFGVAHKSLPCGTRLKVCYAHRCSSHVRVLDRGPFVAGRDLDLTGALATHLRFSGVHVVKWRVLRR